MSEGMEYDLPLTSKSPAPGNFLNRKKNTFKARRESSPANLATSARDKMYFQRRFGIQNSNAKVQDGLSSLHVESKKPSPHRQRGFSDYKTPVRSPHHASPRGASPMEIDGSPETTSYLNDQSIMSGDDTSMFKTALWSHLPSQRSANVNEDVPNPYSLDQKPPWQSANLHENAPNPYSLDQKANFLNTLNAESCESSDDTKKDIIDLIDDDETDWQTRGKNKSQRSFSPRRSSAKPQFPEKSKKMKCVKVACYCNIFIICLIVIGVIILGLTEEYKKKTCAQNQLLNNSAIYSTLKEEVFGQHIMFDIVPSALDTFMESQRVLIMSFHGWTGIGKTFVSTIISNHIRTPSVHKLIIPLHFPHAEDDHLYKDQIYDWILTNITACSINVFIIDEMDKATPGVVLGLAAVLEDIKQLEMNTSRVLVILISNSGGAAINRYTFRHIEHGYDREQVTSAGLISGILSDEDSEWLQLLQDAGTIDHIVPFLPLQREHVALCIEAYIRASKSYSMQQINMETVLDELTYVPKDNPLFSKTGCRKVNSVVDLMIDIDYKLEL